MNPNQLKLRKWHNLERLSAICNTPTEDWRTRDFDAILSPFQIERIEVIENKGQWAIYIDNGADILGVAHLDSVVKHTAENHFLDASIHNMYTNRQQTRLHNPFFDDRLGVYTLLQTLPHIFQERGNYDGRLPYDILLTIDEESGASSASLFTVPEGKEYKWGFEFDATGGKDAKVYQYQNDLWKDALKEVGFHIEYGSFTDISYLSDVGACMVNIASGYYNYHSKNAYMVVEEYDLQLARFVKFWSLNKDLRYEHDKSTETRNRYYNYEWDDYDWRTWQRSPASTKPKTSYTPKGKRTLGSQKPKRDWSWLLQGVEGLDYIKWTQHEKLKSGVELKVEVFYYSGAGKDVSGFASDYIMASFCSQCEQPHLTDELNYERGRILCHDCLGTADMAHLNLMNDWMEEGGAVKYLDGKYTRILSGFDERLSADCPACRQPEWETKFLTIAIADVEPLNVCRWCAAELERFTEFTEDEEEFETKPTTSIVPYEGNDTSLKPITLNGVGIEIVESEEDEDAG